MFTSKLLLILGIIVLIGALLTADISVRIIFIFLSTIILGTLTALLIIEQKQRVLLANTLKEAEKANEELDEQAKLILKTDLKLQMAQEELDKRIEGLYALHELGKTMSKVFNLKELLELIDEKLIYRLGFDKGFIALLDTNRVNIRFTTSICYSQEELLKIKEILSRENNLEIIKDSSKLQQLLDDKDLMKNTFNCSSAIIIPIQIKEQSAGFILIGNEKKKSIYQEDKELIQILATQMSTSIENIYLYEEVWNAQRDLEIKIQHRTSELQKALEEVKRLDMLKKEFVSAVSHELRTPLTSIKGYASILTSGKLGEVSEKQKERLQKINHHSNSLVSLINNLLDISRIESGRVEMKMEPVSVEEVIDETIDLITPQAKEKNIRIEIHKPDIIGEISVDKNQFGRVLINLTSNAVKFTPENGNIIIKVSKSQDSVQFDISDTGIGISKEDQQKLFNEFFRTDDAIKKGIKGTGLGLSLAKKIVEAHNGKIWVNSILEQGTTFSFTIPIN